MPQPSSPPLAWSPPPLIQNPWIRWGAGLGTIGYLALALSSLQPNWQRIGQGLERGGRIIAGFLQPDFASRWSDIQAGMLETVVMAVVATVFGVVVSVPIALGASRNLAPLPVYLACRGIIALTRSVHEVIVAIVFVVMVGFGPLAGVLTLAFATIGFLAKLLAEAIEAIDPSPVEAILATGASWLQVVTYGMIPQVMPRLIGLTLYRLDINLRESAVIGIVGAGGIGATLNTAVDRYNYSTAGAIVLLIVALVLLVEWSSGWVRHQIISPPSSAASLAAPSATNGQRWHRYDRRRRLLNWLSWLCGTVLVVICWSVISDRTQWSFVGDAPAQVSNLLSRAFPPDWRYLPQLWQPLWDTLNIATLGTLTGVLIALPIAFLAAQNTTPHPWVRQLMLLVIVGSRSINSLIWAMLLVAMLGPGIFAGVIAIGLRSIGFIGKLCYEAIEEINPETVEAIAATGANPLQILTYGIVPQVFPAFAGVTIFRWDINIRESTVLGLVGAGGIGLQLNASIAVLRWSQVSVILAAITLLVLVSEWISAQVRSYLIEPA